MKEIIAVIPLFPPSDVVDFDFDGINCTPLGPEVNIIDDEELPGRSVIDIVGEDSRITFFSTSSYPLLVIHINNSNRFCSIIIHVRDDTGKKRIFELSNKKSTITIADNNCKLPMDIGEGWQRICINLNDILSRAFGSKHVLCTKVTFIGTCKLSKLFFQEKDYPDPLLPPFLRVAVAANKDS